MKLIFCFDGTGNNADTVNSYSEGETITNILKLHLLFGGTLTNHSPQNKNKQRSFYYSGVGTRGNTLSRLVNMMLAPPQQEIATILAEASRDLDSNYNENDEIYIFGFSRGAAIARKFAAQLAEKSINVRFIGVFDTVAATKKSLDLSPETYPASDVLFENGTIGEHIEQAVHLVSLDDKRVAFQPTLFNHSEKVLEVWFAGIHADVGGGYWYDGLSDVALDFMIEQASDAGLKVLDVAKINYDALNVTDSKTQFYQDDLDIKPLYNGVMHQHSQPPNILLWLTAGFLFFAVWLGLAWSLIISVVFYLVYNLYKYRSSPGFSTLCKHIEKNPKLWRLYNRFRSLSFVWFAPRLLRINEDDQPSEHPDHIAIIHHTVALRFTEVVGYRPPSLRGRRYRVLNDDGSLSKPLCGITDLREWHTQQK